MLLEHDAKTLLGAFGLKCPEGSLVDAQTGADGAGGGAWIVKAQVPTGGRGKAGGIVRAETAASAFEAARSMIGTSLKGLPVRCCRLERPAKGDECYLSLALEPASGRVAVLASRSGGVDVEIAAATGALDRRLADLDEAGVRAAIEDIASDWPAPFKTALAEAGSHLTDAFFGLELVLAEINPLFVEDDGTWLAGDAKVIIDQNALPRQAEIGRLLSERAQDYVEANLKRAHGFDFVVLDPEGTVGLITTGAGLSMQVADELVAQGVSPFNFCDVRSGGLRGNPERLVSLLRWIGDAPNVKVAFVNIFAGITHLGEFTATLIEALRQTPQFSLPIVARLVGHGLEEARQVVADAGAPFAIETDLDRALAETVRLARAAA